MHNMDDLDRYCNRITEYCLNAFSDDQDDDVAEMAAKIMKTPEFPMHHPAHHYLVAAVLLTECRKKQGHGLDILQRDLAEAVKRAADIPGGACGNLGACGAAVSVGIFWSVITDTTPLSEGSWAYGNRATGNALLEMAETGGPRCCKRCSWIALLSSLPQIEETLHIQLKSRRPVCDFHENNHECIKERCPFYPKEA